MIPILLLFLASTPSSGAPVTTVGRDLVLTQPVAGRVVAVLADVRLESAVAGDVIVWGGDVSFGPGGEISGNLSVFAGQILAGSALPPVRGVVSTPGTLLNVYLSEMRRAPWEVETSMLATGLRLIALGAWLLLALLLLNGFGSPLARGAACAEDAWHSSVLAGVLGILTLFLAAAAALALLPGPLAVPVALLLAAVGVGAKIFGMGSLFLFLGQKLVGSVAPSRRPAALAAGFAVLGGVSLIPIVGPILWSAASVLAVGIALLSRFGRPRYRVALG